MISQDKFSEPKRYLFRLLIILNLLWTTGVLAQVQIAQSKDAIVVSTSQRADLGRYGCSGENPTKVPPYVFTLYRSIADSLEQPVCDYKKCWKSTETQPSNRMEMIFEDISPGEYIAEVRYTKKEGCIQDRETGEQSLIYKTLWSSVIKVDSQEASFFGRSSSWDESQIKKQVNLYPNPANDVITISYGSGKVSNGPVPDLRFHSMLGEQMAVHFDYLGQKNGNHTWKVNSSKLAAGLYIAVIVDGVVEEKLPFSIIEN
jgi:hypothetical protein